MCYSYILLLTQTNLNMKKIYFIIKRNRKGME